MDSRFGLFVGALALAFAAGELVPAIAQVPPLPVPIPPVNIPIPGLDACGRYGDCISCSQQTNCGWCGASGHCMTGANGGSPLCSGGWAWDPPQCVITRLPNVPGDACARNTTCLPCTSQQGCGWCASLGRCMSGGRHVGQFCPTSWSSNAAQCAVGMVPQVPVVDPCGGYSNCLTCASHADCGWCPSLNRCVPGNANGSPLCGGQFAYGIAQCAGHTPIPNPPGDHCGGYNACGTCAAARGCGWCGALNRCVSSSGAGTLCPSGYVGASRSCPNIGILGVPAQVVNGVLNP